MCLLKKPIIYREIKGVSGRIEKKEINMLFRNRQHNQISAPAMAHKAHARKNQKKKADMTEYE